MQNNVNGRAMRTHMILTVINQLKGYVIKSGFPYGGNCFMTICGTNNVGAGIRMVRDGFRKPGAALISPDDLYDGKREIKPRI
jgi:hypothetical protein